MHRCFGDPSESPTTPPNFPPEAVETDEKVKWSSKVVSLDIPKPIHDLSQYPSNRARSSTSIMFPRRSNQLGGCDPELEEYADVEGNESTGDEIAADAEEGTSVPKRGLGRPPCAFRTFALGAISVLVVIGIFFAGCAVNGATSRSRTVSAMAMVDANKQTQQRDASSPTYDPSSRDGDEEPTPQSTTSTPAVSLSGVTGVDDAAAANITFEISMKETTADEATGPPDLADDFYGFLMSSMSMSLVTFEETNEAEKANGKSGKGSKKTPRSKAGKSNSKTECVSDIADGDELRTAMKNYLAGGSSRVAVVNQYGPVSLASRSSYTR